MSTKVGILGSGGVGQTLANGFIKHGYQVAIGTNSPEKQAMLREKTGGNAQVGNFAEVAAFGEMLVLATKGSASESALHAAGIANVAGKVIMDATNPIADAPPVNGVLPYFTTHDNSLMEQLQRMAPSARFVKVFSCVGAHFMINPDFGGQLPTMFICGNDPAAKEEVKSVLRTFGWETEDMGGVEAARAIEPLAMLWCIPGFKENRWNHAFKLLKK